MATVEERVARIRFDNKGFAEKVKQTLKSLESLTSKLKSKEFTNPFHGIEVSASNVDFSNIDRGVARITTRVKLLQSISARTLYRVSDGIATVGLNLVKKLGDPLDQIWNGGIRRASNIESAKFKLEGLGVTGDELAKVWENVDAAVSGTAYSLDAAAMVAAQLAASGMRGGEKMANALRGVSGVAAVTSSSYEDIGRIFTQVAGQGKLMGDQLLQLSGRGMNAAATLAEQMGITEGEVRDMVTKGKIDFQTFSDAMNNAFGDQAMKANNTLSGVMSNIRSAWAKIGADLVTPFITNTSSKDHLSNLVELLNAVRESINLIRPAMKPLFDVLQTTGLSIIQGITNGLQLFNKLTAPLTETVKKTTKKTVESVSEIDKSIEDLAKTVIRGDWGNGAERMRRLTEAGHDYAKIQNVVNEMVWGTYKGLTETTEVIEETTEETKRATGAFVDFRESLARGFGNILQVFIKPIQAILAAFGDVFQLEDAVQIINMLSFAFDKLTAKFIITDKTAQSLHDSFVVIFSAIRGAMKAVIPLADFLLNRLEDLVSIGMRGLAKGIDIVLWPLTEFHRLMEKFAANEEFIKAVQSIGESFGLIFQSIGNLIGAIGDSIQAFFSVFDGPLGKFSDWLIKLRDTAEDSIVNMIAKQFSGLAEWLKKCSTGFNNFVQKSTPGMVNFGKKAGTALKDFNNNVLKPLFNLIGDVNDQVSSFIKGTAGKIVEWSKTAIDAISGWVSKAINPASEALGGFSSTIGSWVSNTTSKLGTWNRKAISSIKTAFANMSPVVSNWAKNTWDTISKWSSNTLKTIGDWVKYAGDKIGPWLSDMAKAFSETFGKAVDAVKDWYKGIQPGLEAFCDTSLLRLQNWSTEIRNVLSGAKDFMFGLFEGLGNPIQNLFSNIKDGFINLFKDFNLTQILGHISIGLINPFNKFTDGAMATVHTHFKKSLKGLAKGMQDTVNGFFRGFFSSPDIPTTLLSDAPPLLPKGLSDNLDAVESSRAVLTDFIDGISTAVASFDLKKLQGLFDVVADGALKVAKVKSLWQLGSMFGSGKNVAKSAARGIEQISSSVSGLVNSFGGIAKSLSTTIESHKLIQKSKPQKAAEIIASLAQSLLKICGALAVLSILDTNKLWAGIGQLAVILGMLGAFAALFSSNSKASNWLFKKFGKVNEAVDAIDKISNALLKLMAPIVILGMMDVNILGNGLSAIVIQIGILAGAIAILAKWAKKGFVTSAVDMFDDIATALLKLVAPIVILGILPWGVVWNGLQRTGIALGGLMLGLIAFSWFSKNNFKSEINFLKDLASALFRLVAPITILGLLPWPVVANGLGSLAIELIILLAAVTLLTHVLDGKQMQDSIGILKELSKAILILASVVVVFGLLMSGPALVKGVGSVAVMLLALGLAIKMIGSATVGYEKAVGTIMAVGVALLLLSVAAGILGAMGLPEIAQGMIAIALGLAALMTVAKFGTGVSGSSAMGLIGVATGLLLVASAIKMLAGLSFEDLGNGIILFAGVLATLLLAGPMVTPFAAGIIALGLAFAGIGAGMALGAAAIWLVTDALHSLAKSTPEEARNIVQVISAFGDELAKEAFNIAKNFVSSLVTGFTGAVAGAVDGIVKSAQGLWNTVCSWFSGEGNEKAKEAGAENGENYNEQLSKTLENGSTEVQASADKQMEGVGNSEAAGKAGSANADAYLEQQNEELKNSQVDGEAIQQNLTNEEGAAAAGEANGASMMEKMKATLAESGMMSDEEIDKFLQGMNFDQFGMDSANMFSGAFSENLDLSSITENMDLSSFSNKFSDIGSAMPAVFGNGFSSNSGEMTNEIQNSINTIPQLFEEKEPVLAESGGKAMAAYSGGMATCVEETVKPQLDVIMSTITGKLDEGNTGLIFDAGVRGAQAYSEGFTGQTADTLVPAVTNMSATIQNGLDGVSEAFRSTGQESGSNFVNGVMSQNESVQQTGITVATTLSTSLDSNSYRMASSGGFLARKFTEALAQAVMDSTPVVIGALETLITAMDVKKTQFGTTGKTAGQTYISNLRDQTNQGMKSTVDTITKSLKELMDKSVKIINDAKTRFKTGGKAIMSALNSGIRETFTTVKSSVNQVLFEAASACYKYQSFYKAGIDCMLGFIDGMKLMSSAVYVTAFTIGLTALLGAKMAVDSNSPSKEFEKLGRYNDEGLVLGMKYGSRDVEKTAGQVSRSAVDVMKSVFSNLDSIDSDLNPVITPVVDLSNIENARASISDLLNVDPNKGFDFTAVFGNSSTPNKMAVNVDVNMNESKIVESLNELRQDVNALNDGMRNLRVYLDTGKLVGGLTDGIDQSLGFKQKLKGRGG